MLYRFDGKVPQIGENTFVSETAIVIGDVRIGNNCYIGHGAILRGDYGKIIIGDKTSVEEGVIIHAPPDEICFIGSNVVIGHGAIIHAKKISDYVLIGMGAIVSLRAEIDYGTFVAEGTIVKKEQKIDANIIVAGNPAQKIRDVTDRDREYLNYSVELYVGLAKKYLYSKMELV
ncbi:MAG: gamma carbonic anhydrase family protein [Syntrophorhabdaceae bacterium]|nr:gamma carbonic anhydrase family protein [Syntrophorhabdaceae bacterium]